MRDAEFQWLEESEHHFPDVRKMVSRGMPSEHFVGVNKMVPAGPMEMNTKVREIEALNAENVVELLEA